jgi:hypothetical protein
LELYRPATFSIFLIFMIVLLLIVLLYAMVAMVQQLSMSVPTLIIGVVFVALVTLALGKVRRI